MAAGRVEDRADVVHAQQLYPLLSPSALVACRRARVPVVLSTHNYALTCPTTHHLNRGAVCESCTGGREGSCILKNCRQNVFESAGYAVRSWVARRRRWFHDNVTLFVVLAHVAEKKLVAAGFDPERIRERAAERGIVAMPILDQMRLQLEFLQAGLEAVI